MRQQRPLLDSIESLRGFPFGDRYLIGVSGGRDSVALLHGLVDLGYRKLIVCHLNHQLRGRSSDADARFVEKLTAKYDLDFELDARDVRALARGKLDGFKPSSLTSSRPASKMAGHARSQTGDGSRRRKMSIEVAAREARYSFFARIAKARRCRTIFLGHHADDLVETFLINLFRGSGTAGLASMREVSKRRVDHVELTIVRPLLGVWRDDIDQYIRGHRLKFREDASNEDLVPMRNRIRRRIIPYLEKTLGRNIRQNIWRTATIAADEENFFETLLAERLPALGAMAIEPLRQMSIAVQRRMLHQWLRASNVADVGFDVIERVRQLLDPANRVAKVNLPQDRHVRRRAKKIFIED